MIEVGPWQRGFGFSEHFDQALAAYDGEGTSLGRISTEHKGGYVVATEHGELKAQLTGKLRRAVADETLDHPSVGDWVVVDARPSEGTVTIHATLPRKSSIVRKSAGERSVPQIVAVNVDTVFLVSALTDELNVRRLERYLSLIWEGGSTPVIVLTKADVCENPTPLVEEVEKVSMGVAVHVVSSKTDVGITALDAYLAEGKTIALIGSSGVGKSTLVNRWMGGEFHETREVRADGKGRHTTTRRQLVRLPWGALIIDTPGMRELGLWSGDEGVKDTFADVAVFTERCKFADCAHDKEPGCAVRSAVESGELTVERFESYKKLTREAAHMQVATDVHARLAQKQSEKRMHKAYYTAAKQHFGKRPK